MLDNQYVGVNSHIGSLLLEGKKHGQCLGDNRMAVTCYSSPVTMVVISMIYRLMINVTNDSQRHNTASTCLLQQQHPTIYPLRHQPCPLTHASQMYHHRPLISIGSVSMSFSQSVQSSVSKSIPKAFKHLVTLRKVT